MSGDMTPCGLYQHPLCLRFIYFKFTLNVSLNQWNSEDMILRSSVIMDIVGQSFYFYKNSYTGRIVFLNTQG